MCQGSTRCRAARSHIDHHDFLFREDQPMKYRLVPFFSLLTLAGLATGCVGGAPSVDAVRWEIQRRVPEARFEPETHVRLGRISMGLIHGLVRMAPGDNDGREMINDVHRV